MGHHHTEPPAETIQIPAGHVWHKIPMIGFGLAVLALLGAWFTRHDSHQFAFSYLVAFFYVLTVTLGCLFFTLFQHATRAGWSVVVRRTAESVGAILPFIILLFIPIYLARHDLYHHWMDPHALEDPIIEGKSKFLNEGFWTIRALIYAAIWSAMGLFFYRTSVKQDESSEVSLTTRLEKASYISIPLFGFSITFAAFDWGMSLDPHWFSTMWGVYMFSGSIMSGFAVLALISVLMLRTGLLTGWVNVEHLHDIGKLMYGFMIFWTYIAFSQYFLIWYSNIPEETMWFVHRQGSWETVGIMLMVGHFVLPFLLLMPRTVKRNPVTLAIGAVWLLVMHFVDMYYIVMPGSPQGHHGFHLAVSDLLVWIGLVGIFAALVALAMKRARLVPVGDPRLRESLAHVNF